VVLSHQDQDHTGGTASVLGAHAGVQVLSSLAPGHAILNGATTQRCEGGQHWVWDGVRFDVLHPTAPDYDVARSTNALSCVIRVSTEGNGASALLTGDIEAAQEAQILARSPLALRADLMVAPHHGSRTSSTPAFIAAVAPRFVLMQSGYRNRFGHPAPEVVARYIDAGVAVHSSPHCGAATWQSVAPQALGCQRALQRRYWHHRAGSAPDTGPSEPEP
jgi:competence protein ComEC